MHAHVHGAKSVYIQVRVFTYFLESGRTPLAFLLMKVGSFLFLLFFSSLVSADSELLKSLN